MKNASKKLVTLLAMLTLVLGMSAHAVLAADIPASGQAVVTSSDTTLNIPKTLKVTNPALVQVAGPGLQLSYTIAPATVDAGTMINDGTNTEEVKPGPTGGLTLGTAPSFTSTELLNASETGAANVKNIVLNADLTKFTEVGVYRYALTDTTSAETLAAAGVERNEHFTNVRYVDIYIQRDVEGERVVEGYVVGSDNNESGVLVKETFDQSTDSEAQGAASYPTPDDFNTYNLKLTKMVTGTMGDRHNQFPFAITVSDSGRAYYADKGAAPSSTTTLNQTAHTTALQTTLAHEEIYYIAGLRNNDTVAYTETNNTNETYNVTVTGESTATSVAPNGSHAMSSKTAPNATDITFTNSHNSVSPTGVVMRFGPYIGMVLIAGLLIMLRKRTKTNR